MGRSKPHLCLGDGCPGQREQHLRSPERHALAYWGGDRENTMREIKFNEAGALDSGHHHDTIVTCKCVGKPSQSLERQFGGYQQWKQRDQLGGYGYMCNNIFENMFLFPKKNNFWFLTCL